MKKAKVWRVLALCLLLLGLVVEALAQGGLIATTATNAQLRVGAGTQWRRIAILPAGTTIALAGRNNDGTWVRGITQNGQVGWVATSTLDISAADARAQLPIMAREAAVTLAAPPAGSVPATTTTPTGDALPPPRVSSAPVRGFSYGAHVFSLNDRTASYMYQAKMQWAKFQVRYGLGGTPEGAAWLINTAHAYGFRVLLSVLGDPQELGVGGYYDQFAAYVAGLAALGADAIEVWNEPNLSYEWSPVDPVAYTNLLAKAYNAIKAANPNTLVISAAPTPTGSFGGCFAHGCDDIHYIRAMAAAGAARYMDCVGVHYNEGILPPNRTSGDPRDVEYYTRYYPSMVNVYHSAFGGKKPLCFTELGYVSGEGYGELSPMFGWARDVTVANQAQWLRQVVDIARRSGRVRLLIIWNLDATSFGNDPQGGYAIIRPDGSCPACAALGR